MVLVTSGCFATQAERWAAFETRMNADIGVATPQKYIQEWGKPAKQRTLPDGSQEFRWEFRGYGGGQGSDKILTFGPDKLLKEYKYDYWPKEY